MTDALPEALEVPIVSAEAGISPRYPTLAAVIVTHPIFTVTVRAEPW